MPSFVPLLYLEWRQAANRLRRIAAAPGRAVLYVLVLLYFIAAAILRGSHLHAKPVLPEPYASAAFFALIAMTGVLAYGAASGLAGVFSSPADARFLTGSQIDERLVVLWLQIRRSASALLRTAFSLFF